MNTLRNIENILYDEFPNTEFEIIRKIYSPNEY